MKRPIIAATLAAFGIVSLLPACKSRRLAEVNNIVPSISLNRTSVPLGSAVEATYTWTCESTAKKLTQDYKVFVHFRDSHGAILFAHSYTPDVPTTAWEPGKTYTFTQTIFVPVYPYVGDVEVRTGLFQPTGSGERVALKGEDKGMREYKVGKIELIPQTENIFLVYKDGWHGPESSPQNPLLERTWTKKDALVSFKNPKEDVIVYLEADTNAKAFTQPPVLTVSVGSGAGVVVPIENSEVFLKKIRFKADALGKDEWVDLRLSMNQSFVPKTLGINQDDRELGLLVYHLYVGANAQLGAVPPTTVVDAGTVSTPVAAASNAAHVTMPASAAAPVAKKS